MQHTGPGARRLSHRTIAAIGGTAIAAGIGLGGLGLGGLAVANAQDQNQAAGPDTTTSQDAGGHHGRGGHGGKEMRGEGMRGDKGADGMATELATALGKDPEAVRTALEEVRDEQRAARQDQGDQRPATPPTEAERQAHEQAFAAALAEKLGVDQQKVTDALSAARDAHRQERTAELTTRLDEAVAAGTITSADKDSVLKAVAAGVLGGPGGPGGR